MGLFRRRPKGSDAVGTVISFGIDETTTSANESSHQHRTKGSLTLEIRGSGAAAGRTVTIRGAFPAQRFPSLGQELPIVISASDPDDVTIVWDRVPTIVERMTELAAQAREAQRLGRQVGDVHPPA